MCDLIFFRQILPSVKVFKYGFETQLQLVPGRQTGSKYRKHSKWKKKEKRENKNTKGYVRVLLLQNIVSVRAV